MGKENPMEDTAKGFSDFGGGVEAGETVLEAAIREGSEELTGFLGSQNHIRSHIKKHGGFYKIETPDKRDPSKIGYTMHIIHLEYDPMLPFYYNNNHTFLWKRMNQKILNASKLFEKIEIEWICEDDLKKRMRDYRHFIRESVLQIIDKLPKIRNFLKTSVKKRKGRTHRNLPTKYNRTIRKGGR